MICPITKIENPIRNILVPALVFVVVAKIFGALFYGILFQETFLAYQDLWRPMNQKQYWIHGMTAIDLFYGIILSISFAKLSIISKNSINILNFIFIIFLLTRFSGEIYNFIMFPYDLKVVLIGMAHGLFTFISWALISNKIFNIKTK